MIVMTLANEKGGVGKTTVAITLAAGMASRGKRVLLIDADAQGHATFGLKLKQEPGFYDLLVRGGDWKSLLRVLPAERYAVPGTSRMENKGLLAVLPGNAETQFIAGKIDQFDVVAERLDELAGYLDVVVIDTSPTPSLLHGAIYLATDVMIYPTEMETFSLNGLFSTIRNYERFRTTRKNMLKKDIGFGGIIPLKVRARTVEHGVNLEKLRDRFGGRVWREVADRITWPEATNKQVPVFNYAPNSTAADDAWEMVDRAMEVMAHV